MQEMRRGSLVFELRSVSERMGKVIVSFQFTLLT
jgi:hypothetical protein